MHNKKGFLCTANRLELKVTDEPFLQFYDFRNSEDSDKNTLPAHVAIEDNLGNFDNNFSEHSTQHVLAIFAASINCIFIGAFKKIQTGSANTVSFENNLFALTCSRCYFSKQRSLQ